MVGVPGRSKGCNTCRQRKVRCGLQRPQCAQCIKSNRVCTGYQRERVFILSTGPTNENQEIIDDTSCNGKNSSERRNKLPVAQSEGRDSRKDHPRASSTRGNALQLPLKTFSRVAYRQKLLEEYISSSVPVDSMGANGEKPWLLLIPDLPHPTRALEMSTLALCTAKLGRERGDEVLVRSSLRLYTEGLYELQKALWDPKLMYRDESLAACMALAYYELVECPGEAKYAYVTHHNGCAKLVQLRGADAHTSGLGRQVFLTFRFQETMLALAKHTPSFLTSPTWSQLPWKHISKTPFDQILDFIALTPSIFKQADALQHLQSHSLLLTTLEIISQCWTLDASLLEFHTRLERSALGPLYWPKLPSSDITDPDDTPEQGKLFPVSFHFLNLRMANTLMFYWASQLMLWNGLALLYGVVASVELDKHGASPANSSTNSTIPSASDPSEDEISTKYPLSQLPPLAHRTDLGAVARNICQSVEYCMQEEMRSAGPASVLAPLHILIDTLQHYGHYARELAWAKGAIERVEKRGLRFLRYWDRLDSLD